MTELVLKNLVKQFDDVTAVDDFFFCGFGFRLGMIVPAFLVVCAISGLLSYPTYVDRRHL